MADTPKVTNEDLAAAIVALTALVQQIVDALKVQGTIPSGA